MLTHLSIRNVVLIEACDIDFEKGLCVLTGETGAGKSILLDALGLALGERAESGLIRRGETQASVTAEFTVGSETAAVLKELELEASESLIIRRTVGSDGKSRILLNDQSITLSALKKIGATLVEIHGQHDQRGLMDSATHRALLDEYGEINAKATRDAHAVWKAALGKREELLAAMEQSKREEDYLRHVAGELKKLNPQEGEEESLTEKRTRMMQSEKLFAVLNEALGELTQPKDMSETLRSVIRTLTRSPLTQGEVFAPILEHLDKAAEAADNAVQGLEAVGKDSIFNQSVLDQTEERLFALKDAARKYNMAISELADFRDQSEAKLKLIDSRESELAAVDATVAKAQEAYVKAAKVLTEKREKAAVKLEKAVISELKPLKMENTHFRARLIPLEEANWSSQGMESVVFEVVTNAPKKGEAPFAPLSKIASGGELSRFMLAMKVALSEVRSTPTLIFDEIDTGTGGAVAEAIGQRLSKLGQKAQVLVVTHLPQVAAFGAGHLCVSKQVQKGHVTTSVVALTLKERKEELARMLSGADISQEARKAAEKLLAGAA